jgi:hypothetical protein
MNTFVFGEPRNYIIKEEYGKAYIVMGKSPYIQG